MRRTTPAAPSEPAEPVEPTPLFRTQSRDGTPRGLTCHQETFGHRPIYICGEAATTTLNPEP